MVNKTILSVFFSLIFILFSLAGCSSKKEVSVVQRDPSLAISCIGVLPVHIKKAEQSAVSFSEAKNLQEGAFILNQLVRSELSGRQEFRFVNEAQVRNLQPQNGSTEMSMLQSLAEQLSCNAMLEISLERYIDRVGGEYTAKTPASVAFQYNLYEMNHGRVLCHGRYSEVQKSLMENLYNWKLANSRGFKWITADQLMHEGLKEKFSQCSYLVDIE